LAHSFVMEAAECDGLMSALGPRVVPTVRRSLPVYPDKQTFSEPVGMSQRCQSRTLGPRAPGTRMSSEQCSTVHVERWPGWSNYRRRLSPTSEPGVRLDSRPEPLGIVVRAHALKNLTWASPQTQEVKIQGVSVLPIRKPTWNIRLSGANPRRWAERISGGLSYKDPPRRTRRRQSPPAAAAHAEPSVGAPL
jgi:hypothetical protein